MNLMNTLIQGVLAQFGKGLGPQGQQMAQAVIGMMTQQGQGQGAAGLTNMIAMFENNGMGEMVKSWVGTGANMPVNPQQIMQALGQGNVQNIAQQMGVDANQASTQLAKLLPDLINQMTPNGKVEENLVGEMMNTFLGKKAA